MKTRVGIVGYGNLGKGVEKAIQNMDDLELSALFTRRDPKELETESSVPVYSLDEIEDHQDDVDVLILCGGSATDLPVQTPRLASLFNVVDSFDTHANIPQHFEAVDQAAKDSQHAAIISIGWDPGLFSLNRLLNSAIMPQGETFTFWGKGVSQGHSDAIRRIEGVKDARQYTIPIEAAMEKARQGSREPMSARDKHLREAFVVLEEGADPIRVEREIVEMPNYFSDYDTTVHFISQEELDRDHKGLPHGGFVIHSADLGDHHFVSEYKLDLDSNPEFTSSVLLAYARAAARLAREGQKGAFTIFDVAPAYLSPLDGEQLRKNLL